MNRLLVAILPLLIVAPVVSEPQKTITMAEYEQVMLARDLGSMSVAANAAILLRDGKTEKAVRLFEGELASSLDAASRRVDAGVRLPMAQLPSLAKAPERARDYAISQNRDAMAKQAADLLAKLK